MGGLINNIFGGGSRNAGKLSMAYGDRMHADTKTALNPFIQSGHQNTNFLNNILTGSGPEQEAAFQRWLDSGDYKFAQKQGMDAVTGNAASRGLLKSGATLQALQDRGQQTAMGYRDNWLNKIMGLAGSGQQAAHAMAGANQNAANLRHQQHMDRAAGNAQGVNNFLDFGMGIGKLLFSDRRLKTAIRKVGEFADGLGIYTYRYITGGPELTGVMADEVAQLRPWALGPAFGEFATVDYGRL